MTCLSVWIQCVLIVAISILFSEQVTAGHKKHDINQPLFGKASDASMISRNKRATPTELPSGCRQSGEMGKSCVEIQCQKHRGPGEIPLPCESSGKTLEDESSTLIEVPYINEYGEEYGKVTQLVHQYTPRSIPIAIGGPGLLPIGTRYGLEEYIPFFEADQGVVNDTIRRCGTWFVGLITEALPSVDALTGKITGGGIPIKIKGRDAYYFLRTPILTKNSDGTYQSGSQEGKIPTSIYTSFPERESKPDRPLTAAEIAQILATTCEPTQNLL